MDHSFRPIAFFVLVGVDGPQKDSLVELAHYDSNIVDLCGEAGRLACRHSDHRLYFVRRA